MFELVVARYNENVSWVDQINDRYIKTVYNKVSGDNLIPNFGREAFTYFYHIVNQYDNLADFTAFVQAGWQDNRKIKRGVQIIEDLNNINEVHEYINLVHRHPLQNDKQGRPNGILDIEWCWNELFKDPCPEQINFCPYSMFGCSRERIHNRTISFYKKCLELCTVESNLKHDITGTTRPDMTKGKKYQTPWIFERLFDYIFSNQVQSIL